MKITHEALNKGEEGTKHWSSMVSSMVVLSLCASVIAAAFFDYDFIESTAICAATVVLVSAIGVFTLEKPTPRLLFGLLVTGFILSPVYSAVGQGIVYLLNLLNTMQ